MNRFRAILVRWDKKLSNNIAGLHLACAYITFKRSGVFGYALNQLTFFKRVPDNGPTFRRGLFAFNFVGYRLEFDET